MTLLHFVNCLAAAYAPYFIAYRFSGLSEYSALWRCIRAGVAYIVTQIIKMLVLATVFPVGAMEESKNFIYVVTVISMATMTILSAMISAPLQEVLKCSVDVLDVLGLYVVLTRVLGRSEMKVMVTAVGWGTAEMAGTKVIPLWVGARGVEFQWDNLQSALDANINLLFLMVVCMLLWLWSRKDLNPSLLPFLFFLLAFICYRPVLLRMLQHYADLDLWTLLLFKFGLVMVVGIVTLQMYTALAPPTKSL